MNMFFLTQKVRGVSPSLVRDYVISWIKNPDPGSAFEKKTRWIRWLYGPLLFWIMRWCRYDGVLLVNRGHIIGHLFFQKHGKVWKVFSLYIREDYRKRGFSFLIITSVLRGAFQNSVRSVFLGRSGNDRMMAIREGLLKGETGLPFKISPGKLPGEIILEQ